MVEYVNYTRTEDRMPGADAPITWETDYDVALQRTRDEGKHLFIYFHKPN